MTRMSAVAQRYLPALLAVTFLAGVLIGLVVLGWGVWPVKWVDASPADLREEYRHTYLWMAADSYAQTGDAELARQRMAWLESSGRSASAISAELDEMAQKQITAQDAAGAARLQALGALLAASGDQPSPIPGDQTPGGTASLWARLLRICGLVILVLVILAGLLLLVYFLQSRTTAPAAAPEVRVSPARSGPDFEPMAISPQPTIATAPPPASPGAIGDLSPLVSAPEAAAIGPFVATYSLGDIDFDMSFGIESPNGDFLGECGLGMAETIGGGDVQRVTAFEVWLFDKTDIRTVSLVLASAHAHTDPALRTKLASRGEVVLAQPGGRFSVQTSSLRLEGQLLDLAYGGGDVPSQSYFTSFSVELVPVLLEGGEE